MNFYGNIEIVMEGKELTYVLSVGIDFEKGDKKYMPSFAASKNYGDVAEKNEFFWDNDDYLKDVLYERVVIPWVNDGKILEPYDFAEFVKQNGVNIEDLTLIKLGFDKAIEMGFFENVK